MKKRFALKLVGVMIISVLIFAGLSVSGKITKQKFSNVTSVNTITTKDVKSITDNDLINSSAEDTPTQLDSVEDQTKQLTPSETNLLLNDDIK
ncbi:hypothetical protein I6U48_00220 [Clostridium sp. PL3]|uniref:Uncharacterized protein n=1 Tax=Clostridium thailandense TaxID=2794346 RepID=A0A949TU08_9CLOT|nr:hypothetical protein [Clostridium thailandense]MBV7271345.1 hypothetical protein [Clostridium thailandense]